LDLDTIEEEERYRRLNDPVEQQMAKDIASEVSHLVSDVVDGAVRTFEEIFDEMQAQPASAENFEEIRLSDEETDTADEERDTHISIVSDLLVRAYTAYQEEQERDRRLAESPSEHVVSVSNAHKVSDLIISAMSPAPVQDSQVSVSSPSPNVPSDDMPALNSSLDNAFRRKSSQPDTPRPVQLSVPARSFDPAVPSPGSRISVTPFTTSVASSRQDQDQAPVSTNWVRVSPYLTTATATVTSPLETSKWTSVIPEPSPASIKATAVQSGQSAASVTLETSPSATAVQASQSESTHVIQSASPSTPLELRLRRGNQEAAPATVSLSKPANLARTPSEMSRYLSDWKTAELKGSPAEPKPAEVQPAVARANPVACAMASAMEAVGSYPTTNWAPEPQVLTAKKLPPTLIHSVSHASGLTNPGRPAPLVRTFSLKDLKGISSKVAQHNKQAQKEHKKAEKYLAKAEKMMQKGKFDKADMLQQEALKHQEDAVKHEQAASMEKARVDPNATLAKQSSFVVLEPAPFMAGAPSQ